MRDAVVFALTLTVLHAATLFGTNALFGFMFRRGIRRDAQVDGGRAPKETMLGRCTREVALGQLGFLILVGGAVYPLWRARGGHLDATWDPPLVVLGHLLLYAFIVETLFYWSHRALHTPWLYKHVHSRHHRFVHVRVPVAEYAHGVENALNFVGFFAGPVILGAPFTTICVWVVLRIIETAEAHSGYALTPGASRHAYHHLHAHDGCYGSAFAVWDTLLGTDRAWRATRPR